MNLALSPEDCEHAVIDEFLCMVAGCALGTDQCHWMCNKSQHGSRSTRLPFNCIESDIVKKVCTPWFCHDSEVFGTHICYWTFSCPNWPSNYKPLHRNVYKYLLTLLGIIWICDPLNDSQSLTAKMIYNNLIDRSIIALSCLVYWNILTYLWTLWRHFTHLWTQWRQLWTLWRHGTHLWTPWRHGIHLWTLWRHGTHLLTLWRHEDIYEHYEAMGTHMWTLWRHLWTL